MRPNPIRLYTLLLLLGMLLSPACRKKGTGDADRSRELPVLKEESAKANARIDAERKEKKQSGSSVASSAKVKNIMEQNNAQSIKYQTFEGKVSAVVHTGKNKLTSKATIRIKKDEVLQLSAQPLMGIEMFRLIVTPRQVTYIDRMNQCYFQESANKLTGDLQAVFDYHILQSLFTNRLFTLTPSKDHKPDTRAFTASDYTDQQLFLTEKRQQSTVMNRFILDSRRQIVESYIGDRAKITYLLWQYSDFDQKQTTSAFPKKMVIQAAFNQQIMQLRLSFNSISLDRSLTISDDIPARYTRITMAQLTKLINNLQQTP